MIAARNAKHLLVAVMCSAACNSQDRAACSTDIVVYDAHGSRLGFTIAAVFQKGRREAGDVRRIQGNPYGFVVAGGRLHYSEKAIGRSPLDIELVQPSYTKVRTEVALMACRQRVSVQYGELHSGADASWSTLTGQIVGCDAAGDWWVKATPMFADYRGGRAFEGIVHPDGRFEITSSFRGGRYIIVFGKGKEAVKVASTEIVEGTNNDAGVVDLGGACPK